MCQQDTYPEMRDVSDQLCQEYQLQVIEETKSGKAMHYSEWQARPGRRGYLAGAHHQDIDGVIQESVTLRQFFPDAAEDYFQTKRRSILP